MALYWTPRPESRDDAERWDEQGKRWRLFEGEWEQDALDREAEFFSPEVREFLPRPELSRNVFASVNRQIAVLYDEPWEVRAGDADGDDLAVVLTEELLPLCQQRNLYTEGCNECLMRLDIRGEPGKQYLSYRVVPAHMVVCQASKSRPDVPDVVSELRPRVNPNTGLEEWTWETWDVSDPTAPTFKIESIDERGERTDVTDLYVRDETGAPSAAYPYKDGAPIFPYVLYHRRVSNRLWAPFAGMELPFGTLTSAAGWTMWLGGLRDGAYPQRYSIDCDVVGSATAKSGAVAVEYQRLNHLMLLQLRSRGERQANVGQFQPAMDPKSFGEALADFDAGLAIYADVSPSDLQVSRGESGYAIVVRRDGVRRAQRRQMAPALLGDRLLLATAARLANAYLGASLPTEPAEWSIRYGILGQSPEERKALVDETLALLAAGLLDQVTAWMRLNPGATEDDAAAALARVGRVKAAIEGGTAPEDADHSDDGMREEVEAAARGETDDDEGDA